MSENSEIPRSNSVEKSFILPREAWTSKLAFFREILIAKQSLDRIKK